MEKFEDDKPLWSGPVDACTEEPISRSPYDARLEAEELGDEDESLRPLKSEDVRFWSDFSRIYYAPKSIHRVPDTYEAAADDEWNVGQSAFRRYDEETGLMENATRSFVEECDNLQGVQFICDTGSFGSFMNCFLIAFHDDFEAKLPSITFPILSGHDAHDFDPYNAGVIKKTLNNALCLRSLAERSSLSVLIRDPSKWSNQMSVPGWKADSLYHTSALLSAHLETSTLPLRLKREFMDMGDYTHRLNGTSPFATLNGVFPVQDTLGPMVAFSTRNWPKAIPPYASLDITRGFSEPLFRSYDEWKLRRGLPSFSLGCIHTEPYPLPSSFPVLVNSSSTASVFTTLSSTPTLAPVFSAFARYVDDCVKWRRGLEVLDSGTDDMLELREDLINLVERIKDGWESDSEGDKKDE